MNTATVKTDRYSNRAPRGGAVSPINDKFYAGGQWMPMASAPVPTGPAPLAGSTRQVAWAARLRREALNRLDDEIFARMMALASPFRHERADNRRALVPLLTARHALTVETSAAKIIDRRSSP
jgi:hypothetical protein